MGLKNSIFKKLFGVKEVPYRDDIGFYFGSDITKDYFGRIWQFKSYLPYKNYKDYPHLGKGDPLIIEDSYKVWIPPHVQLTLKSIILDRPSRRIYSFDVNKIKDEGAIYPLYFFYPYRGNQYTPWRPPPENLRYFPDCIFKAIDWWDGSDDYCVWTVKDGILRKYNPFGKIQHIYLPFQQIGGNEEGVYLPHNFIHMKSHICGECGGTFLIGLLPSGDRAIAYKIPPRNSNDPITTEDIYPFKDVGSIILDVEDPYNRLETSLYTKFIRDTEYKATRLCIGQISPQITTHIHYPIEGWRPDEGEFSSETPTWLIYFANENINDHLRPGFSTTYFDSFRHYDYANSDMYFLLNPPNVRSVGDAAGQFELLIADKRGAYYFGWAGFSGVINCLYPDHSKILRYFRYGNSVQWTEWDSSYATTFFRFIPDPLEIDKIKSIFNIYSFDHLDLPECLVLRGFFEWINSSPSDYPEGWNPLLVLRRVELPPWWKQVSTEWKWNSIVEREMKWAVEIPRVGEPAIDIVRYLKIPGFYDMGEYYQTKIEPFEPPQNQISISGGVPKLFQLYYIKITRNSPYFGVYLEWKPPHGGEIADLAI